jgi:hypothetical protein
MLIRKSIRLIMVIMLPLAICMFCFAGNAVFADDRLPQDQATPPGMHMLPGMEMPGLNTPGIHKPQGHTSRPESSVADNAGMVNGETTSGGPTHYSAPQKYEETERRQQPKEQQQQLSQQALSADGDMELIYNDAGEAAGAEVYYDNITGNMGVGTMNPASKLHVAKGYMQLPFMHSKPPAKDCSSLVHAGRIAIFSNDGNKAKLCLCDSDIDPEKPGNQFGWVFLNSE